MQKQYTNFQVISRLLSEYIKPYRFQLAIAVFFMIVVAICSAAIVKLVQPTVDQIFLSLDKRKLVTLPLIMLGIYSAKGIAEFYQSYLIKYIGQRVLTDLQLKMYDHLLYADLEFIQSQSAGRLISRFTNDVSLMRGAVSNLLVGCAKHFLSVLFLIFVMFRLEPILSLIVFLVFPLAIYPVQKLGRNMRKVLSLSQEELGNFTAKLDETFYSIKITKSFLGEKHEAIRARKIATNILSFYKRAAKLDALVSPIMEILSGIAVGGIIWYGGWMVIEGKTTPGELFAFIIAFTSAYRPFKSLVSLNVNLQEGLTAARRVFNLLDIKPEIHDGPNAQEVHFKSPTITFNEVALNFNKKTALKPVNCIIPKNKVTAIVGRSGSGKTSLANLLVRFYNPTSGEILIDDINIKDIKVNSLRRQIALVTQDTILFDSSVADNIAYGRKDIPKEQIITAAKLADAHDFIQMLPEGYDTLIGSHGATLSGGQRQKLSLARAFLKDASLLILDEGTSSLDQNSEQNIFKSLTTTICNNKTTLIITHRLTTIIEAHKIIVMHAGEIVETGTHESLIQEKGEYYKLYNRELEEEVPTIL